jgi:predicted AlkP superfamily phosphohydrolase/phosphomutase
MNEMRMSMHRTILIGLDGATWTVLDPLMAGGHMPALRALVGGGVRADLRSTPHPLTPPAWTTLMTGVNPGRHGIFDFLRAERRKGGAFFTLNNYNDIRAETIWSIVSRSGGRVVSVNFPLMAPPPAIHGAVVPGMLSWKHLRANVHPAQLYDELKALPEFDAREISWDFEHEKKALQHIPDDEAEEWVRWHIRREQHWFKIVQHVMSREPADLVAVMFDGVDKLQHACWRFLDPCLAGRSPSTFEQRMHALCREYFAKLDGFIARIIEIAGSDARIFVASDHGFGPTDTVFRVNNWLHERGWLAWPSEDANLQGGVRAAHHVPFDMVHTRAYAQSGATNGVHIRVSEEPGDGGVPPAEYESFRDQLVRDLRAVRDPDTGQAIVRDILRREDVFPGPHMHRAPDLTLVLFDHGFVSVVRTDEVIWKRPNVTGTHYPIGVLAATGPGLRRGARLAEQNILDMAPTLLHSLGLPVPEDFEGRVIADVFDSSWLRGHAVHAAGQTMQVAAEPTAPIPAEAAEQDEEIMDRLRALGYVE